jgi:hypothetical protein
MTPNSEDIRDWLFTALIDTGSIIMRDPFQIGSFEITSRPEAIPAAEAALAQSIASFNYAAQPYKRMRTTLVGCTSAEARRSGTLHAREALTLFKHSYWFVDHVRLLGAGCLTDLRALHAVPFVVSPVRSLGGVAILRDDSLVHPTGVLNRLMRVDPSVHGELGLAVRRSAHWADLATRTEDLGERFFMRWLAIECLCRVDQDESINAKIAAAARFPNRRYEIALPADERTELAALTNYTLWRRRVNDLIDKLRDLRNAIAHSGFRELDLRASLTPREVYLARKLIGFAYQGVQTLALNALDLRLTTIAEMWNRYADCLLLRRQISVAHEVSRTIIFTFENPSGLDEE